MRDALSGSSVRRAAWLERIGGLALVAGLAIGGLALAAPVGVWLGWWSFQRGFQLLFNVASPWGNVVAIAAAAVGVTLLVLGRLLGARGGAKAAALAFVGALAAWLGHSVPESYRPGEDIPPIHDISTDTDDPPQFVAVLPLRANASNTVEYGRSEGMTPEELAALTRAAYPDLATVTLAMPPEEAFARALNAVDALGWDLVAQSPQDGRIEATDTTFWFRFKDDIVIRIRPAAGGGAEVDARSVSRVGRGDAGTNARRLRAFFEALDEER